MKDYKRFKLLTRYFGLLLVVFLTGCAKKNEEQYLSGPALGTSYHITFYSEDQNLPIQKVLDSIFESINLSMSTYQEDSDISRINAGNTNISVDKDFRRVFEYSKQIYEQSDGYFDPTVGNLVNAYGFGPNHNLGKLSQHEIDSLMQFVGFNKLQLTSTNKIEKEKPGIYLDFNAIAKGYTVDVIARYLDSLQVQDYLIELGGELVAKGINKTDNIDWVVAIDDPLQSEESRTFQATLKLKNRAMATSGNYRKFRVDSVSGKRYVHTINPITGESRKSNLLSTSVLAENCAMADGYATAFMALGLEKSKKMLKKLKNVEVYLIYSRENGEIGVFTSEGFKKILLKD